MLEREIRTEIEIAAPPEAVWAVLADLASWSEWNPVVLGVDLRGPLAPGASGKLRIQLGPPLGKQVIPVRIVEARVNRELAWVGGPRGLMRGRHGFRLRPTEHGTQLVHYEVFSGVLAPGLIGLMRKQLEGGYSRLNQGLRDRCESGR